MEMTAAVWAFVAVGNLRIVLSEVFGYEGVHCKSDVVEVEGLHVRIEYDAAFNAGYGLWWAVLSACWVCCGWGDESGQNSEF